MNGANPGLGLQVWGSRFLEVVRPGASPSRLKVSLAFLNFQIVRFLLLGGKVFCLSASFRRNYRSWVGLEIRVSGGRVEVREDGPNIF